MTNITAYVFTDLTEPVRAATRAALPDDMNLDDLDATDRRRAMSAVLPAVNEAAHVIARDVLSRVNVALSTVVQHDVTCTTNFDDDAACDCTWQALEGAFADLVGELETPADPDAAPKWDGNPT